MTRTLIVEDEPKAARVLKTLIRHYLPEVGEIAIATNGEEALAQVEQFKPQLVFLDVEMPGMDGFAFLEAVKQPDFGVVFTTAFDQYAIRAIRYSALDYLLKPVDPDELIQAYHRFESQNITQPERHKYYQNLQQNLKSGDESAFKLLISTSQGTHFLHPANIIRCLADRNYTHLYQVKNQRLLASKSLNEFETLLVEKHFLRIHRSHLVNLNHIRHWQAGELELSDGSVVPISRRKRAEVSAVLNNLDTGFSNG